MNTWAQTFKLARGPRTQVQAAADLSGPTKKYACNVASIRDWEQGRSEPPGYVQHLIVARLMRLDAREAAARLTRDPRVLITVVPDPKPTPKKKAGLARRHKGTKRKTGGK